MCLNTITPAPFGLLNGVGRFENLDAVFHVALV